MKKRTHLGTAAIVAFVAVFTLVATDAFATPAITSAVITPYIWDNDATSVFTSGNTFSNPPSSGGLFMQDASLDDDGGTGWANRHIWRYSDNGSTEAVFLNDDGFYISADVTLSGPANMEGGLQVTPWWGPDGDGVFMLRTSDGEISCWGGRLPFYNFTASQGLHYVKGETVNLAITYVPRALDASQPGIIKYDVTMGGTLYESPWLAFSEGNTAEDPPYGLWGILNGARVGGYLMGQINNTDPSNYARADFDNMVFLPEPASLALLALGGLALLRRR